MRKPATEPPKPPERDYTYLRRHGVRGWFKELKRLREQALIYNPELLADDPKIDVREIAGNPRIFLPGAPLVQFVGPQQQDVRIPLHLLPALVVNINAQDAVIIAEFTRKLEEARKLYPPPVSKPGRHAPNDVFDQDTFKKWLREDIVPFADLLAWNAGRKARGESHYTEYDLGLLIDENNSARNTSEMKVTLKRALASLPSLIAQLKYDRDPDRKAADLREADAMEDPDDAEIAAEWAKDM